MRLKHLSLVFLSLPIAATFVGCGASGDGIALSDRPANIIPSGEIDRDTAASPVNAVENAVAEQSAEPIVATPPSIAQAPVASSSETPIDRGRPFDDPAARGVAEPPARPAFQFAHRRGRQQDLTFDDLKFPMEKTEVFQDSMLTEKVEALEGTTIRIRGFMLPSFQQSGITRFILVRDNQECCFGPGAALFDCIVVDMEPGKSTEYATRPIAVQGVFRIKPFIGPDGKHLAVFHLDGQQVGS